MKCGIKPSEFWDLTIYELNIIIECFSEKQETDYKNNLIYAYYNAYWQRVKDMPDLHDVLNSIDNKEMTDEEMFITLKRSMRGG